jgi:hypothetical protein
MRMHEAPQNVSRLIYFKSLPAPSDTFPNHLHPVPRPAAASFVPVKRKKRSIFTHSLLASFFFGSGFMLV